MQTHLFFKKQMENLDWVKTVLPSGKDEQISSRNNIFFVTYPCISTSWISWIKNAIFSFRHIHYIVVPRICRMRMKAIVKTFYTSAKVRLGKQWQLCIWDWNFGQVINHFKCIGVWDMETKLQWPIYPFSNSTRLISFFICEAKVFLISFIQWQNSVSPYSWEYLSEKVTATQSLLIDKM